MLINVNEAEGVVLDWLVAKALGIKVRPDKDISAMVVLDVRASAMLDLGGTWVWSPTTNYIQAGSIMDRERIESLYYGTEGDPHPWESQVGSDTHYKDQSPGDAVGGSTRLEAAMRCYVIAKLGDQVEVPDEICKN